MLFRSSFNIPEGMDEKQYDLKMSTYYDYNLDKSEYKKVSDEIFVFPLKVEGNCVLPQANVTAILESGGKAGETLVVKATITNSGTESTTYTFSAAGYTDWASSAEMDNSTLTLAAGESQDILVSFEVKKSASGDQTFDIETYSEASLVSTQPVQVSIEARNGLGLAGNDSAVAILIALISAIAIAIIIVLIVRASRT